MKKSELKQIIKEEVLKYIKENSPQTAPSKPRRDAEPDVMEPPTTKPEKPRRRTLEPPKESPNTKPKALYEKAEQELVKKIAARFKKLSK